MKSFLDLNGAGYASTPAHASFEFGGDHEWEVELAYGNWSDPGDDGNTNHPYVFSRWPETTSNRHWSIQLGAAGGSWNANVYWTENGSTTKFLSLPLVVPDWKPWTYQTFRFRLDVDNGASGHTATGEYLDADGVWVQFATATGSGITSVYSGATSTVVSLPRSGFLGGSKATRVRRAVLRNGFGGTEIVNPDFSAQTPGTTSFADGAGRTWTITPDAAILQDLPATPSSYLILGVDDYVQVPHNTAFTLATSGQLTVEGFVRFWAFGIEPRYVIAKSGTSGDYEWSAGYAHASPDYDRTGASLHTILGANVADAATTTPRYRYGAWHHFALTLDQTATRLRLYLNGAQVAEDLTWSGTPGAGTGSLWFGRRGDNPSWAEHLRGDLADVRVWSTERTAAQLRTFMMPGVALTGETGLQGRWLLNETSGTTVADSSGNARNGTLTGGTWSAETTGAVTHDLAAVCAATTTVAGAAGVTATLAATVAADSTTAAALAVPGTHALAAASAAVSTVAAVLQESDLLAATVAAVSTVTGILQESDFLVGTVAGVSTHTAEMTVVKAHRGAAMLVRRA